jgi:hypothetical protein
MVSDASDMMMETLTLAVRIDGFALIVAHLAVFPSSAGLESTVMDVLSSPAMARKKERKKERKKQQARFQGAGYGDIPICFASKRCEGSWGGYSRGKRGAS